jgi:hypothetical protein
MGDVALMRSPSMRSEWPQSFGINDYVGWLSSAGFGSLLNQTWTTNQEKIEGDFAGLVRGAYQSNGIVFACEMTRFLLFQQARFQFQQMRGGQPGDLFGTAELSIIERPEPGETTADLLSLAMLDADLAGDWFGVRRPGRIKRLRPDYTVIIVGTKNEDATFPAWDPDAEIIGYSYSAGPWYSGAEVYSFDATEVAHWAPIRDPLARYRGMPLPTAVIRDIRGDTSATTHKLKFFDNAATPNLIVKFPPSLGKEKAREIIELFEQDHSGAFNAYRTMYLLGGAEAEPVGKDFQQLEFAATQGKGETRIVAAMGLHPTIVPVSEGLQGSSLNAGNFGAARRLVADKTLRPYWGSFAGSLETIIPPVSGSRLWYDERHIPFLAEDVKDAAEIIGRNMLSIEAGVRAGFNPETIVDAVVSGDLRRLTHTGLFSVQLQPAGTTPVAFSARADFWPVSGLFESNRVTEGDLFSPDHPIVAAFPSMFTPAESPQPELVRAWNPTLDSRSLVPSLNGKE